MLIKHLNALCVVLNICYLVGNYSLKTKQFGEVLYELTNGPFGVYILYLKIYLRIFFNLLKLITEVVIEIVINVFFTYREGIDYDEKSLQILNSK